MCIMLGISCIYKAAGGECAGKPQPVQIPCLGVVCDSVKQPSK